MGMGIKLGLGLSQRGGGGAPFLVTLTGLTDGEARIGDHASIGYTTDATGETVKWSNSSDPAAAATYGTGASPTDYTAGDEGRLYLHVTADGDTVTRSAPIRYAPGNFGALTDQSFDENSGDQTYVFPAATGTGLTWTYAIVDNPPNISINSGTRTVTFDTDAISVGGSNQRITATDQYGRSAIGSPRGFSLVINGSVTGALAAQESGSDTFAAIGTVVAPSVTGSMSAQETGLDTMVASGAVSQPLVAPTASNALADLSLTVDVAMTPVNVAADFNLGNPTATVALQSGTLPTGLSFDGTTLSGTPTVVAGNVTLTFRATNSEGTADTAFQVTVEAASAVSETWVITGHSITDAFTIKPGFGNSGFDDAAATDGITYTDTQQSGPYSSASFRYSNRTTLADVDLAAAISAGGDYLVGIEAMDDNLGLIETNDFGNPPAAAFSAATNWHNDATAAGFTEHFYVRWYGSNTPYGGFNQAWRDNITGSQWTNWDSIKTYVDANKTGSMPFTWVYLDAAFAVLFDRIQAGTYTQFSIGDFFTDNVHCDTNLGHWLSCIFVWCSIRGTDPDAYPLQLGDMSAGITSAQKAELVDLIRDVIANPTIALPTPTVTGSLAAQETGSDTMAASGTEFVPVSTGRLMVNTDQITYYGSENPFLDLMKGAELQGYGGAVDANGWPTSAASHRVLTDNPTEPAMSGRYRVWWDGSGSVSVSGGTNQDTSTPGQIEFDYAAGAPLVVTVDSTNASPDHVRNIRCVKVSEITAFQNGAVFRQAFKDFLSPYKTIRFMNWQAINGSQQQLWANRPTPEYRTWMSYSGNLSHDNRGVPVESMVQLCNETGMNPWFNIPHLADDTYVTEFATYVRDNLNPALTAYIEYSNEVWNSQFPQTQYWQGIADTDGRPGNWMELVGERAQQVMDIFTSVFGGTSRLMRVHGVHPGWAGLEIDSLTAPNLAGVTPHTSFDAIATTTYFGGGVLSYGGQWQDVLDEDIANGREAAFQLMYNLVSPIIGTELEWSYHDTVAGNYGWPLLSYEGGTHIVTGNTVGTTDDARVQQINAEFGRSDYVAQLYTEAITAWEALSNNGPFNQYKACLDFGNSIGAIWGILEYPTQADLPRKTVLDAYNAGNPLPTFSWGSSITGSMAATETGSDTMVASGTVEAPVAGITGSMAAQETGSDTMTASGTVSAPAGDTPSTILGASIIEWLDPQDASSMYNTVSGTGAITTDGDLVGRIVGKVSSTNFDATGNTAARPIYRTANGGYLEGSDGNNTLLSASLSRSGALYFAMRMRIRTIPASMNEKISVFHSTAGGMWWNDNHISLISTNFSTPTITQEGGGPGIGITENTWHTIEFIFDTDNRTISVDGTDNNVTSSYTTVATTLVTLLGEPGGDGPNMDIGRAAFANAVPSAAQRTDMRSWLES